jgi:hypothetical protein
MTSWDDYWKTFDLLIEKLKQGGQGQIGNELRMFRDMLME